jgi:uncharacterized membrane protein YbaN (DUF454 family)
VFGTCLSALPCPSFLLSTVCLFRRLAHSVAKWLVFDSMSCFSWLPRYVYLYLIY